MDTANIHEFITEVQRIYASGVATEHSYRAVLGTLFDSISDDVSSLNEPKASVNVGRPDFVFQRMVGDTPITIGHCEAKDIGLDVSPKSMRDANKAQHTRYVKALPNLIYTNCLDFHFYKDGELVREISIGDFLMGIQPKPDQYDALANQLTDFAAERLQTITSAQKLAKMMAGKAVLVKDVLFNTLKEDEGLNSELAFQFKAFQDQLINDLSIEEFSDIYAETIAYGMFGARLHDETKENFSREEALELLPKSNPFLRKLFEFVAGPGLDEGLRRTIDELADIFQATDLQKLFENFGSFTQRDDPFIHFYETFLAEYNPKKRKARGVWYTPEPVVNFIVRAVDDVLKTEFGLPDGLADTSKVTVDWDTGQSKNGKPVTEKKELHRVQILDPAAGTGTFLAEIIKQIAPKIKDIAPAKWPTYVEQEMIPRLHGFELLMASYAMCHMKLEMMLKDMGYKPTKDAKRLGVYLTNSLEEGKAANQELPFAQWLSNEAKEANTIKRDMPIMCVIGNPPYSGESANKGDWIMSLMEAYKKEPGGKEKLKERNPKWINDDYVKFIRLAETMIEKNGEGVLGFITNHGYLDNPTFRGMRWHLLKTFDKIYVLDLHGNAKKKEVSPDGSPDKNVFDIMQGVAIIIGVKKKGKRDGLGTVFHGSLWGTRKGKYDALWKGLPVQTSPAKLENRLPQMAFIERDYALEENYLKGFGVQELMPVNSVGIVTARDALTIDMDKDKLWARVEDFTKLEAEELRAKYSLGKDVRDWRVQWAIDDVIANYSQDNLTQIAYRPFDKRWTFYTGNSRGFQCYPRDEVMRHMLSKQNLAIITARSNKNPIPDHFYCTNIISETKLGESSTQSGLWPLYLYPDTDAAQSDALAPTERTVNFDPKIRKKIEGAAMGAISPTPSASMPSPSSSSGLTRGSSETMGRSLNTDEMAPAAHIALDPRVKPEDDEVGESEGDEVGGLKDDEVGGAANDEGGKTGEKPDEVAIFDYIYGVLHCPAYRETYKEFLKIDFPRIPYPTSPQVFWDVSAKGTLLRQLHLMEDAAIGETPYKFEGGAVEGEDDSVVVKPVFTLTGKTAGTVHINKGQYFADVPKIAWEFYIGGYQPAQKWLKDRKGRELSFDDIRHYQKIIKILSQTDTIMKTIEMDM